MSIETIFTLCCGGLGGSLITICWKYFSGRIQKMECHYMEDDVLSKIPQKDDANVVHQNIHCKRFLLINTTNQDISDFKIIFQFDSTSKILECYSRSKEGYNRQKVSVTKHNKNEAFAFVKQFNRGDKIEYTFTIADISDNMYYVTEAQCIGFKIKCVDKRTQRNKSKSKQSDQILINRHEKDK